MLIMGQETEFVFADVPDNRLAPSFFFEGIPYYNMWGNGLLAEVCPLRELYSGASPAMNFTARPWKPAHPWFRRHRRDDSRSNQHLTPSRWGAGTAAYFTKWMYL